MPDQKNSVNFFPIPNTSRKTMPNRIAAFCANIPGSLTFVRSPNASWMMIALSVLVCRHASQLRMRLFLSFTDLIRCIFRYYSHSLRPSVIPRHVSSENFSRYMWHLFPSMILISLSSRLLGCCNWYISLSTLPSLPLLYEFRSSAFYHASCNICSLPVPVCIQPTHPLTPVCTHLPAQINIHPRIQSNGIDFIGMTFH